MLAVQTIAHLVSVYCTNLLMLSLAAHLSIALLLDTTLQLLNLYAMCAASQV